jgi:hypothetical protein
MRHLLTYFFLIFILSGCELATESDSDSEPYAKLIGIWKSSSDDNSHFIKITSSRIQKLTHIQQLNCVQPQVTKEYIADERKLSIDDGDDNQHQDYSISNNTLTLTDQNSSSVEYSRYTDELLQVCSAPELEGSWVFSDDLRNDTYVEFSGNINTFYFRNDALECYSSSFEYSFIAHNNKIIFFDLDTESINDQFISSYLITGDRLAITSEEDSLGETWVDNLTRVDSNSLLSCGDKLSIKEVDIKISVRELPVDVEKSLEEYGVPRNFYGAHIIFDIDNSGTTTTGDIKVEYRLSAFLNENNEVHSYSYANIFYIEKIDNLTRYSSIADVEHYLDENSINLTIKASDLAIVNTISNGTQIKAQTLLTTYKLDPNNEGSYLLSLNPQDYFPSERLEDVFTSGLDTVLLFDTPNDRNNSSFLTGMIDIEKIEVTIRD